MRRFLCLLFMSLGVAPFSCAPGPRVEPIALPAHGTPPRFERVLVYPGGGFQFAMFLGMLDGLESQGERPDVVIGSCGGAVAAAIATTIGSSAERKAFVESPAFFRVLRSATVEDTGLGAVLGRLWSLNWHQWFGDRVPDVFNGTLVSLPARVPVPVLDRPFGASGIRAVIVAARVKFQPAEVGNPRNGRKLYQEVFFTDAETAGDLGGFDSPIARLFPESAVGGATEVIRDRHPGEAARVSITDPFYLNPVALDDGHYYLTGAIDLYPVEVAQRLAKRILMPFPSGFKSFAERKAIKNTFDYDNTRRLQYVTGGSVARWIDISDADRLYAEHGFDPRFHVWSLSVKSGVPEGYEEYRRAVQAQWAYGRERAIQALREPENSKAHIRVLDDTNTTPDIRCQVRREACQGPLLPGSNR